MNSKNDLDVLIEQQPILGAKIGRQGHYKDRYIYHLSEDSFDNDIRFLKNFQSHDMVASLFPQNQYSEFGMENLSIEKNQSILNVVKRAQISTLFEDLSGILNAEHLESLNLTGPLSETEKHPSSRNVLNLSSLVNLQALSLPVNIHSSSAIFFSKNTSLRELGISHLQDGGVNDPNVLRDLLKLRALDLFRYKVEHLQSISHLKDLRLLICDYSRTLRDLSALSSLSKLERVDFENCPNLMNLEVLAKLPKLKVLRLNKCRSVKSLSFLRATRVECLEFFGTAIEDNDLSFLSEMKNLKIVRYSHKRSYNVPHVNNLPEISQNLWHKYTHFRDQYLV